jgi:hypothetical protein
MKGQHKERSSRIGLLTEREQKYLEDIEVNNPHHKALHYRAKRKFLKTITKRLVQCVKDIELINRAKNNDDDIAGVIYKNRFLLQSMATELQQMPSLYNMREYTERVKIELRQLGGATRNIRCYWLDMNDKEFVQESLLYKPEHRLRKIKGKDLRALLTEALQFNILPNKKHLAVSKDEIRVRLAEVKSKNVGKIIPESMCITCGRDAHESCLDFGHTVRAKRKWPSQPSQFLTSDDFNAS